MTRPAYDPALRDAVRAEILEGLRVLTGEGMFEKAFGHISARLPGTDLVCVLGHIHAEERTLGELHPEDVVVADLDGNVVEGSLEPPGEFAIHTGVYRMRPDVGAVVHCHPRAPVTLSIARQEILPVTWRASIFGPRVPLFEDPRQIETPEAGAELAHALGNGRAVVLMGHGVVCVGETVGQAAVVTLDLNDAARFQLGALAAGGAHPLDPRFLGDRASTPAHAEGFTAAWQYFRAKYRVANSS